MIQKRKTKHRSGRSRDRQPAFSRELLARTAEMVARGELMPLKNDAVFKMFLSAPTPESNACLRSMLSALTGREVTTAKVTNAELLPEYTNGKKPRLPWREANDFLLRRKSLADSFATRA